MEQAIKDGKPLTEKNLPHAQGLEPKPEDADDEGAVTGRACPGARRFALCSDP